MFENGRVALTWDLVFGLAVFTESGWYPFAWLNEDEKEVVRRLLDYNPTCPKKFSEVVYASKVPA